MYHLDQIDYIAENQQAIILDLEQARSNLLRQNPNWDTTWSYHWYNIWSITSPSIHMYRIFVELKTMIRTWIPDGRPLWLQSWVNWHEEKAVLDWHTHQWPWHGYISIDAKQTHTEWRNWQIKNRTGQVYFGQGGLEHRVTVDKPYEGSRITIGFDVTDQMGTPWPQTSLIPI